MDRSYKEQLYANNNTIKEKDSLIKQLEGSVEENKSRLLCADSRLQCTEEELKLKQDVCNCLKENLASAESEKNYLELRNQGYSLEVERLCKDNKDVNEFLSSFVAKVAELDKEHASMSSHVSRLLSSFEKYCGMVQEEKMLITRFAKDKFVDLTSENSGLKNEIGELKSRITELQKTQEIVMVQHVEECQVAEDKIRRLESGAEISSSINRLEKLASELQERVQKLLEDSSIAENHKQELLQKTLKLESDNQELLRRVQSVLDEKFNDTESLHGEIAKRDQQVDTFENQVNELCSVLDEKEQLYICSVEREKSLEEQKLQVQASLAATECQLTEAKKQYDLMLEGKQIELSKHLKELSLRNDQAINDIRKKYELEKVEIINAEKEKAEKLIREMENKCNEKISENKRDSESCLMRLKEEHGAMRAPQLQSSYTWSTTETLNQQKRRERDGGRCAEAGHGGAAAYGGELTFSVLITCIVAASGGLIFGYDIGISGGVSQMKPFLEAFFPKVLRRMADAKRNQYCVFDSHALTAFTSSLYVAGLVASLAAGRVTRSLGRRGVMLLGGALFFAGGAMTGAAMNLAMLIAGRMLLGFGVGFTNQATPLYLAEMAPAKWRGSLTAGFQFFLSLGILIANLTNYGTARLPWGWRLSLGLAGAPAIVIVVGAFFLTDTPSSFVMRGKVDLARAALLRVRGPSADVDAELKDIAQAVEAARGSEDGAFRRLVAGREYRPHLTFALALPLCHQLSGMMVLTFFSPLVFRIAGFGSNAALMGAVILAAVKFGSLILSTLVIDRYGRKVLVMAGAVIMVVCQVANAWIMGAQAGKSGEVAVPRAYGLALLVLTCVQGAGFGMSWAPLIWVIPGEIFPLEVRSAGQSVSVSATLGLTFLQTQTFLALLCRFKYATFAYYAGWVVVMTAFVMVFLPETKGLSLESMGSVWEGHWYWRRFVRGGRRVQASPSK